MEGELIFLGFIMLIGQIILLQMWNNNWFKKENFKMEKSLVMSKNKLSLRKLEKEMGLIPSKNITPVEGKGALGTLTDLAPLLKNLDADQLGGLIDKFVGGGESGEGEGEGDLTSILMDYATKNPEMVQGLLEGLTKGKPTESVFNS